MIVVPLKLFFFVGPGENIPPEKKTKKQTYKNKRWKGKISYSISIWIFRWSFHVSFCINWIYNIQIINNDIWR